MTIRSIAKRLKTVSLPEGGRLVIKAELYHIEGNTSPHFSVTATEYDRRGRDIAGGCMHEDILKHAPEFGPAIALHLSDDTGIPMYAVENGWYWAGGHPGLNRKDDKYGGPDVPNAPYLASHLRIELAEAEKIVADVLAGNMTKEQFTGMVVRMQPRWYQEARAVIEWMLAGRSE